MSRVVLKDVVQSYGDVQVIHGVNLEINDNEFVVFVGPSGCGKSTLLRSIAGLEDIDDGEIWIGDRDVTDLEPVDRGISMVFQSYALYPHMSVEENMSFGLKVAKVSGHDIKARVADASEILQLDDYLDRKPSQLSGGQRQRVAIGRAIVRKPDVFLFDEPLSNLDAELRVHMRIEIAQLHKKLGATMIYVTHDQVEAMTLADKIVVLQGGVVRQIGSPLELYDNPDNQFVAGFIGSPKMNFLSCHLLHGGDGNITVALNGSPDHQFVIPVAGHFLNVGEPITLGVRPEHLSRQKKDGFHLPLRSDVTEQMGDVTYVHADAPGGERVVFEQRGNREIKEDCVLDVYVPPSKVYLFTDAGARVR